jgi:O-acetyl-ADP-ribose deacetylase (regulator of RNase III)
MLGYLLPAKFVIHTVGPIGENSKLLSQCYWRCLELAKHTQNIRSIAFPCISTGVYGYPNAPAARVAIETVQRWLSTGDNGSLIDQVIFCTFLDKDAELYEMLLSE